MKSVRNALRIVNDAFSGKIDDDYLSQLTGSDLALAISLRDLYHTVSDQVVSSVAPELPPIYDEESETYL